MREAFHLGGFGMYPTLVFGLLLLAASFRYAVKPERRFVPLLMSLGLVTLMSGCLGFSLGLMKSFGAMGEVVSESKWIWMIGASEALNNVALALILALIGGIAASVGALRIARGEPEAQAG